MKKKDELIQALVKEIELRKNEISNIVVDTLYFGGGTPSLLTNDELQLLIDAVHQNYKVTDVPEITLEANPDDLTQKRIKDLTNSRINRLSIGIQSFFNEDLKLMNRTHDSQEAKSCLDIASEYFENISIDLIYGIPGASNKRWQENIDIALSYELPHISSYALTIEPRTALESFIRKGIIEEVDEEKVEEQFLILVEMLEKNDFIHYELSNFGKEGFFSKNNSAYWQGRSYIGIGPSAHSYNGEQRSWNIKNNSKYITALAKDTLPSQCESLSINDKFNERVMTGLRTVWGVSLEKIEIDFGEDMKNYLLRQSKKYVDQQLLYIEDDKLGVTKKGKFLCDGIASELFKLK